MSWDAHRISVLATQVKLNQVHAAILAAAEEQDIAMETMATAVGSPPATEIAVTAFNATAAIAQHLNQALVAVNQARDAMTTYGNQF